MFGTNGFDKEWLTAVDGRERDAHRMANGQKRDPLEPFNVGGELLMLPGDPRGSASNIINCRCVVAEIPKEVNTISSELIAIGGTILVTENDENEI